MKASGNKPPMTVASKGIYMHKDLLRNADYFGINLKFIEVSIAFFNFHRTNYSVISTNNYVIYASTGSIHCISN